MSGVWPLTTGAAMEGGELAGFLAGFRGEILSRVLSKMLHNQQQGHLQLFAFIAALRNR
jgi:hypothetical protein